MQFAHICTVVTLSFDITFDSCGKYNNNGIYIPAWPAHNNNNCYFNKCLITAISRKARGSIHTLQ